MKKLISFACVLFLSLALFAQNNRHTTNRSQTTTNDVSDNEISLVVSGEGQTKEEATASALRSAIEQAFGTFVSANTTLLNDDIVRDEIATVTSGNIKSYKELSCIQNANGLYNVSVSTVVSIGNLISYAQSHGSSAEFAGQTFVMNIKMRELNKQNEAVALQNLIIQLKSLQNDIFDFIIRTKEPLPDKRDEKVKIENGWMVPVELTIKTNENYLTFVEILNNTLSSLSLSEREAENYEKNGMEVTLFAFTSSRSDEEYYSKNLYRNNYESKDMYILRNETDVIEKFALDVCDILYEAQESCMIQAIGDKAYTEYPFRKNKVGKSNVGHIVVYNDRDYGRNKKDVVLIVRKIDNGMHYEYRRFPTEKNFIFRQSDIPFYFTMDELSKIAKFTVVKEPMSLQNRVKRFKIIADKVGFPYVIQNGTAKINLGEKGSLIIDFNNDLVYIDNPPFPLITKKMSLYFDAEKKILCIHDELWLDHEYLYEGDWNPSRRRINMQQ